MSDIRDRHKSNGHSRHRNLEVSNTNQITSNDHSSPSTTDNKGWIGTTKSFMEENVNPAAMEVFTRSGTVAMTGVKDALMGAGQAAANTTGATLSQVNKYTPDVYDVGSYGNKDLTSDAGMFIAGNTAMVAQNAYRIAKAPTKYAFKMADYALYGDHKGIHILDHHFTQGYRMSRAKNASADIFQNNKLAKLNYSEIATGQSRADVWNWRDRMAKNRYKHNDAWRVGTDQKLTAMKDRFRGNKYSRMQRRSNMLKGRYNRMKATQFSLRRSTVGMVRNQSRKLMNQAISGNDPNSMSSRTMHVAQKGIRGGVRGSIKTARQMWVKRQQIVRFLKTSAYTIRHPLLSAKAAVSAVIHSITNLISALMGIITSIPVVASIVAVLAPFVCIILIIVTILTSIFGWVSTSYEGIDPNVVANKEYALNAFIYEAKRRGWKKEAIIGTMSYIIQEGGAMGTFTYESYWIHTGASGKKEDTMMDNDAWLKWLNSDGLKQAHESYASMGNSHYAAIGIGLLADSDVWYDANTKEARNATMLIAYAESQGKPWQDPETQLTYYFEQKFANEAILPFDTAGVDPTKDERTAEEWCRRVTAGIGMPAWSWTTNNAEMSKHTAHLDEATKIYNNYKSFTYSVLIGGTGSLDGDPDFTNEKAWKTENVYAPSWYGQCTWFAWGRFYEIYGYSPGFTGNGSDCVSQLLAAHPDKFKYSRSPAVGAVFSTGGGGGNTNHVGIVVGVTDNSITVQDGNYNGVTDPWEVAITDWKTMTYTTADFNAYMDPVYAIPITAPKTKADKD